ncbi:hypothetical protein F5X99DRAFT_379647 [Biscogniauxia marginata]|nr:hypothetical protein F5X99DRAFT_379647 [Biscogniauxia marginata]
MALCMFTVCLRIPVYLCLVPRRLLSVSIFDAATTPITNIRLFRPSPLNCQSASQPVSQLAIIMVPYIQTAPSSPNLRSRCSTFKTWLLERC